MPGLSGLAWTYTFSNSVLSSVLLSPLCGYIVFPGPETPRFLRTHWLPSGSQPHVTLQSLPPAPSAPGPPPAFPVSEIGLLLAPSHLGCWWWWFTPFFLPYYFNRALGRRGEKWLSTGQNLIVSYVNSFRLPGPQYYFRYSAWRQSCDWGFSQKGMLSSPSRWADFHVEMYSTFQWSWWVYDSCFSHQVCGWDAGAGRRTLSQLGR